MQTYNQASLEEVLIKILNGFHFIDQMIQITEENGCINFMLIEKGDSDFS